MRATGIYLASNLTSNLPLQLMVFVSFVTNLSDDRFYVGGFNIENCTEDLLGNVDIEPYMKEVLSTENGEIEEQSGEDDDEHGLQNQDDENNTDSSLEIESDQWNDELSNNLIDPKELNGSRVSFGKGSLFRSSDKCNTKFIYDDSQMEDIIEELSQYTSLQKSVDTLFWCIKLGDLPVKEKLVNVLFLDRTCLKIGGYKTILNLVGITCDNRFIPIAHMLQSCSETIEHTTIFLNLVKKYIPILWDDFDIMCDLSVALEKAIPTVFGRDALTCSVHLYKDVVKHASEDSYKPFFTMMNTLDEKVRSEANEELIGQFNEGGVSNKNHAYVKVSSAQSTFCRSLRRDNFDLFTTNAVKQFRSCLDKIKRGNLINFLSHTLTLQANALNKLTFENSTMVSQFTSFGEVMLSLNIAMALLFTVTPCGIHYKCKYDIN